MAARAAFLLARGRWLVLAFWVAATVAATIWLPSIGESQSGALGDLVPRHAKAIETEQRSFALFGFPLLSRTLLVERAPGGLTAAQGASVVARAAALTGHHLPGLGRVAAAVPVINVFDGPPFAPERGTTALTYLYFRSDVGAGERLDLAHRILREHPVVRGPGAYAGVTGLIRARADQSDAIGSALPLVEALTVLLVAGAVALHFRAPGPALATLATVGIAYAVAVRVLGWLGERLGIAVPSEVEPVVVVLLFGIVCDYAIFFLSRFRRRLADGEPPVVAAERMAAELLGLICIAGLTVCLASASLIVAHLGFFQAFGPGTAVAVLVGLLVAVSFLPAALAVTGRRLYWPARPGIELPAAAAAEETPDEHVHRPRRTRIIRLAARRPKTVALACVVVLLGCASGLLRVHLGDPVIRGLPAGSEARQAYAQLRRGFAPGMLSPTVLVVEQRGLGRDRGALDDLQAVLRTDPGFAGVLGAAQQPFRGPAGAVLARSGNAARYVLISRDDPLGATALRRLAGLRGILPGALAGVGLGDARFGLAGDTALSLETLEAARSDMQRVAPVALAAVLLMLAVLLRALVAPLYLAAASVLALAASLGLTVWVFEGLAGRADTDYLVPFAAGVLLLALGSDYNVFLTGRIRQEAEVRPLREAVAVAGARAARAITVAGIVLALSFSLLALVPVRTFRELAFAMSAGLLIDAFLVRTVLVPALISLFGLGRRTPRR